jgi:hypothetical protein
MSLPSKARDFLRGLISSISVNAQEGNLITAPSAPWHSNGYASSTPAGRATPKAIQDLLNELEASKQSRLRAWRVLQRLRMVLSEVEALRFLRLLRRHSMQREMRWNTL